MVRAHAVIGLLLVACTSCERGSKPEREFPDRIVAGSFECESCGSVRGQACGYMFEYGCPDGKGSCGTAVPCDPECCAPSVVQRVGLDEAPWGPVLAAAAADERPPVGMIGFHDGADLFLVPPDRTTPEPTPLLRLHEAIRTWRVSAVHRQLLYTVLRDHQLRRVDLVTRTSSIVPDVTLAAGPFAVTARGDRVGLLLAGSPSGPSELGVLDLATGSLDRWVLPSGRVEHPVWDPLGTRLAFEVYIYPVTRVRIVDVDTRTIVNSARDAVDLTQPAWHPGGDFLAVWEEDAGRCTLVFMEPDGVRRAASPLVVESMGCLPPTFSPDGRHLLWGGRIAKLAAPTEGHVVTARKAEDPQWLTDEAAAALGELAGFGL